MGFDDQGADRKLFGYKREKVTVKWLQECIAKLHNFFSPLTLTIYTCVCLCVCINVIFMSTGLSCVWSLLMHIAINIQYLNGE